jgi:hypothetical protein
MNQLNKARLRILQSNMHSKGNIADYRYWKRELNRFMKYNGIVTDKPGYRV